jgi:FMN phosphatase YigB (HAD superfamily)
MKQALTEQRDTVIFDCDGVFYSWNIFGGMDGAKDFCAKIKVEVIALLLPFLSAKEVVEIGKRSYEETGDGLRYFVDIAIKHGMDGDAFREEMHTLYHQQQLLHVRERVPQLLAPCPESTQHLAALRNRIRYGMLSQGCRDNWLRPLLNAKGVLDYFNPNHLFGFKEFGWNEKSINAKGLGILMDVMEVKPSQVVFVEDTMKNLYPVKVEYEEVLTTHLHDWQMPGPDDDYIDLSVASNLEFLRHLRAAHFGVTPHLQRSHDALGLHL